MYEEEIYTKMKELSEDLRKEVLNYINLLLSKYRDKEAEKTRFRFHWEGGLSDIKDKFTSVDMQHRAMEWR